MHKIKYAYKRTHTMCTMTSTIYKPHIQYWRVMIIKWASLNIIDIAHTQHKRCIHNNSHTMCTPLSAKKIYNIQSRNIDNNAKNCMTVQHTSHHRMPEAATTTCLFEHVVYRRANCMQTESNPAYLRKTRLPRHCERHARQHKWAFSVSAGWSLISSSPSK